MGEGRGFPTGDGRAEHGLEPMPEGPCVYGHSDGTGNVKVPVKGLRRIIAARQCGRAVLGAGGFQAESVDGQPHAAAHVRRDAKGLFHVHEHGRFRADRNLLVGHFQSPDYSVSRNQTVYSMLTRK